MTKIALLKLTRAALVSASCLCAASVAQAQQQPGMPSEAPAEEAGPPIDLKADWPCVQGKVESLSVLQVWDGPSTEGKKGWGQDKQLSALITILASRRISEADAEAALKKYADTVPEAERDEKLTLLFAGLFDKVNMERKSVISGIGKYQKAQRARAEELERQGTAIAQLESKRDPNATEDTPELEQAREKFNWAQRIFQERQQNIPLACELPTMIEERLFAVSRAIRALMKA
jgi:hypothetical protein